MKKFSYLLILILGLSFTACEPLEDIHDEIDAELDEKAVAGSLDYTLTDDDYDELGLGYYSFNSEDEAKELIPVLLSDLYPALGAGSSMNVSFDLYDPLRIEEYTVASSEYTEIGLEENYFSGFGDIEDFLSFKFPQAEQGEYVELTYQVLADEEGYTLTDEDFELIEDELGDTYPEPTSSAANYGNFERRDGNDAYWSNEMILEAINVVLSENIDGVIGQKYNVSYDIYDGSSGTESMTVQFDGNSYISAGGTAYALENEDYDLIGDELGDDYPGPAGNAAQYNSFDIRSGEDNYWSQEMILEAINIVLMEEYPAAEEGAKFEVSYDVYSGGVSTVITSVVMVDGVYVIDQEASVSTIEETKVYAYTNGRWNAPYTLDAEAYTEMGQSYPNFDDEDEAIYKLEIYLGEVYPYAEAGDFVALAYNFYSGGTSTRYANFIYENGEWNHIPSVIEKSIQFGHDGTGWVPDNTIRYRLTGSDYGIIASVLEDEYPVAVESMNNYSNFDRRDNVDQYWSDDMLLQAMGVLADAINPNAEVGQKYVFTFDIYNGTNTTESLSIIKDVSGEWILNE